MPVQSRTDRPRYPDDLRETTCRAGGLVQGSCADDQPRAAAAPPSEPALATHGMQARGPTRVDDHHERSRRARRASAAPLRLHRTRPGARRGPPAAGTAPPRRCSDFRGRMGTPAHQAPHLACLRTGPLPGQDRGATGATDRDGEGRADEGRHARKIAAMAALTAAWARSPREVPRLSNEASCLVHEFSGVGRAAPGMIGEAHGPRLEARNRAND